MRTRIFLRIMLAVAPIFLTTVLVLAFLLQQQTLSHFVVYLSGDEQLDRLPPAVRSGLVVLAENLAAGLARAEDAEAGALVERMSRHIGDEVVAARGGDRFYLSEGLSELEADLELAEGGLLRARLYSESRGIASSLEIAPLIARPITPFTRGGEAGVDTLYVYRIPAVGIDGRGEARFVIQASRTIGVFSAVAAVVSVLLVGLVLARVLRPVGRLTSAVNLLSEGDAPEPVPAAGGGEIAELATAFNRMVERLNASEKARRRLLSDVSHELRGPLSNLRSALEAVQDGLLPADDSTIAALHGDTLLLSRLVDDLHELTLADARSLHLDIRPVHVEEVIGPAVSSLRPAFGTAGVDLRVDLAPDLPPVAADPQRLVQVLHHLLRNALRHAGAARVRVGAHAGSTARDGAHVLIEVADDGRGVPEDAMELIFERLYRPDASRSRISGGSGLGLAVARALVTAQGGTIRARANEPRGLVIRLRIPIAQIRPNPHGISTLS